MTESELAATSGEAAASGGRASGTTIAAAQPVAKSFGEAQPLGIAMELKNPHSKREERYATAMSERQAPIIQTVREMMQVPQGQQLDRVISTPR